MTIGKVQPPNLEQVGLAKYCGNVLGCCNKTEREDLSVGADPGRCELSIQGVEMRELLLEWFSRHEPAKPLLALDQAL